MNADAWRRIKDVCAGALERPPEERAAYLDETCGGDAGLRAEVESLLLAYTRAGDFIEQPAAVNLTPDADVAEDPQLGRAVGPYVIEEVIGRGGMGDVYLGRRADQEFEQHVAIKMIRRGMDSAQVVKRFRHERQILASLNHPHIAGLFDGGTTADGLPYFVMEYVDGLPINQYADRHTLTTTERLQLCLGVLDAVQHAHDRQIVHRDLKPSNVLVTSAGHPKLLDFGIAKILTPDGDGGSTFTAVARPMTPHYASPEQVLGGAITPATDVYALGLLLYELLTGHRPFQLASRTPEEVARAVCEEDPERPSAVITRVDTETADDGTVRTVTPAAVSETREGSPERLRARLAGPIDAILLKALRKEPAKRYPSVAALSEDVRRFLAAQPVDAGRDARRYRAFRWARRHRPALTMATLAVCAAIVGIGSSLLLTRAERADRTASGPAAASSAARQSVAVVGFRNLSGSADRAWLSTAIAEMLTTELAGDGQLRVVPSDRIARAMRDASLTLDANPSAAALAALRRSLGADLLVLGTFAAAGGVAASAIRLDIRVHNAADVPVAAVGRQGDAAQLFSLVADAGRQLRARLGLRESSAESVTTARAAFPASPEGTRLYSEGVARLRVLDAVGARDRLERAAALDPASPLIQTTLASAWTALGYDAKAAAAARHAFEAAGALTREDRLAVEGRLYEAERQWPKAAEVYRTLWGFFSDNIEYGLRLAAAETGAGRGRDALATVDELRRLPNARSDPRIDLQEAEAAAALSDYAREEAALARARASAEAAGARGLLARAQLLDGRNQWNQGRPGPAQEALEQARALFVATGDGAGAASALNSLGVALADRDPARAVRMYEQSLAVSEKVGDRRAMSAALNNLGILLKDQRRFDEALRAHQRALALRREIGDRSWTAVSLGNIGVVLFEQGRFAEAAKLYQESIDMARAIGDRRQQVRAQHNLAIIARETGDLAAAQRAYEESLAVRQEINDRRGGVMGRVELSMVLLARGDLKAARRVQEEALQLARETRLRPGEAQALSQGGEIALAAGDAAEARRQHEAALAIRRELGEARTVLESQVALAALRNEEGRPDDARREAQGVLDGLGAEPAAALRIPLHLSMARAHIAKGDVEAAARAHATARNLASSTSARIGTEFELAKVESEIHLARGQTRQARDRLTALGPRLARADMKLADLGRRLLLLRVDAADRQGGLRDQATALERAAAAIGAASIARQAAALRQSR